MSEFAELREQLGDDEQVVFVAGNFNVLHPGHIRLLRFASSLGSHLVVGIYPDSMAGVDTLQSLRLEAVQSNRHVSHAFALEETSIDAILELKPQIVVMGGEHKNHSEKEKQAVESYGGQLIFSSGDVLLSTYSDFYEGNAHKVRKTLPTAYMQRHSIDDGCVKTIGDKIKDMRVIVIGDLIIDEYVECDPLGMSQEDPTIVVTPVEQRRFVGGAGIVAGHAKGLGANVRLITVVGDDETAEFARDRLSGYSVQHDCLTDISRPTTLKKRYRAHGKTLLRVSNLAQHDISKEIVAQILEIVKTNIDNTDLILFSDFNYGCVPDSLVRQIAELAREAGVAMSADSQASSQLSDITRFRDMKLITPTELEARMALKDRNSGLAVIGEQLLEASAAEHAIITMGADGLMIFFKQDRLFTDQIPAINKLPKDVAGAGDSLFCATSLALAGGFSIWEAGLFGSVVASHQVDRLGNEPIQFDDVLTDFVRKMS